MATSSLFLLAFGILIGGAILELVLYFAGPEILGRAAFIPFGADDRIPVGPNGQELLSGRRHAQLAAAGGARETPDYRSPPVAPQAVAPAVVHALGVPPKSEWHGYVLRSDVSSAALYLRLAFRFFGSRSYGIVRTRLRFDGQSVHLQTSFLPVPSLSYGLGSLLFGVGVLVSMGVDSGAVVVPLVFGAATAINGLISWFRLKPGMKVVRMQLEGAVRSLG